MTPQLERKVLIYAPMGSCDADVIAKIRAKYPNSEFISRWVDGAMMWQDAAKGL